MQPGRTPIYWPLGALALAFLFLYWGAWNQWFFSDDFSLLLITHERGLITGFFSDLLINVRLGEEVVYWRPGWYLMFGLLQSLFGVSAAAFVGVSLLMHFAQGLLVFLAARSICNSSLLGLAAGVLFWSSPAYSEAVMWQAASMNVLPCSILLFLATRSYLVYVFDNERLHLKLAWSFFLASMLFKEAGYAFPLIVLGAHGILGPRNPALQDWIRYAMKAGTFGLVILFHYLVLSRTDVLATSTSELMFSSFQHVSKNLSSLFGLGTEPFYTWAICLPFFAVLWFLSSRRARFLLFWALVAMFPYALQDSASRFLYFCHAPWALFFAVFVSDLRERSFPGAPLWAMAAVLLLAAGSNALKMPTAIKGFVRQGEMCKNALSWARKNDIARCRTVYTGEAPPVFDNGFEEMLQLYLGKKVRVEDLGIIRTPPFLVHNSPEFAVADERDVFLRYEKRKGFVVTNKEGFLGGLIPVPSLALVSSYQVEVDPLVALKKIQERRVDLNDTVILGRKPVFSQRADDGIVPTQDRILTKRMFSMFKAELEIEVTKPTFLVVSLPVPADNVRATIDGKVVEILRANASFHAVPLPIGRHTVVFQRF